MVMNSQTEIRRFKALVKTVLPEQVWRRLQNTRYWSGKRLDRFKRRPPVGWVRFGSFRRLQPIDRSYGWQWGKVLDRYYIEKFLEEFATDIHGRVLEVAENSYTLRFGGERVTHSDVLHYVSGNPRATIVADLTDADHIPSNTFDCIVLTQTLQFIYNVGAAIRTLHRILKPGGVLLMTCHGISQISRFDMRNWGEYWRFTSLSVQKLFSEVFPEDHVTVQAYGNVLTATAFLHGLTAGELLQEELDYRDPDYELILGVRAMKPRD
jgi:SAM-dependent methyltransferase